MSDFADWYVEGKAIPVAHPIPWVYAEVDFPTDEQMRWRVFDYKSQTAYEEVFELESRDEWQFD